MSEQHSAENDAAYIRACMARAWEEGYVVGRDDEARATLLRDSSVNPYRVIPPEVGQP